MYTFRDFDLPVHREVLSALQVIKGVGWRKATCAASKIGIGYPFFMDNLNFYHYGLLNYILVGWVSSEAKVERFINGNIRVLMESQSYRGLRHRDFLPVRGQRTRTNAGVRKRSRGY